MAIIKTQEITSVGKNVQKGNPCAFGRNVNWYIYHEKQNEDSFLKIKTRRAT